MRHKRSGALAHDVDVYPLQYGRHKQDESEEAENGKGVRVEAIVVIGHGDVLGGKDGVEGGVREGGLRAWIQL